MIWWTGKPLEAVRHMENMLRMSFMPIIACKWLKYKPFAENY